MRTLANFISVILLLPSLVFACGFLIFSHTMAATSLLDFLFRLLMDMTWTAMLVFLALVTLVVLSLVLLGISDRLRWIAGWCVAILSVASMLVLTALSKTLDPLQNWDLFVPGLMSLGIGSWLAAGRIAKK